MGSRHCAINSITWKKRLLESSQLYAILDHDVCLALHRSLLRIARYALEGGARLLQLRAKGLSTREFLKLAQPLRNLCRCYKSLLVVNDRVDIAAALPADGVHLGQEDLPFEEARKILGKDFLVGISCNTRQSIHDARGADYVSIGAAFFSPLKPKKTALGVTGIKKMIREFSLPERTPVFIIGGINSRNLPSLLKTGVTRIAVCRAICEAPSVTKAVRDLQQQLTLPAYDDID